MSHLDTTIMTPRISTQAQGNEYVYSGLHEAQHDTTYSQDFSNEFIPGVNHVHTGQIDSGPALVQNGTSRWSEATSSHHVSSMHNEQNVHMYRTNWSVPPNTQGAWSMTSRPTMTPMNRGETARHVAISSTNVRRGISPMLNDYAAAPHELQSGVYIGGQDPSAGTMYYVTPPASGSNQTWPRHASAVSFTGTQQWPRASQHNANVLQPFGQTQTPLYATQFANKETDPFYQPYDGSQRPASWSTQDRSSLNAPRMNFSVPHPVYSPLTAGQRSTTTGLAQMQHFSEATPTMLRPGQPMQGPIMAPDDRGGPNTPSNSPPTQRSYTTPTQTSGFYQGHKPKPNAGHASNQFAGSYAPKRVDMDMINRSNSTHGHKNAGLTQHSNIVAASTTDHGIDSFLAYRCHLNPNMFSPETKAQIIHQCRTVSGYLDNFVKNCEIQRAARQQSRLQPSVAANMMANSYTGQPPYIGSIQGQIQIPQHQGQLAPQGYPGNVQCNGSINQPSPPYSTPDMQQSPQHDNAGIALLSGNAIQPSPHSTPGMQHSAPTDNTLRQTAQAVPALEADFWAAELRNNYTTNWDQNFAYTSPSQVPGNPRPSKKIRQSSQQTRSTTGLNAEQNPKMKQKRGRKPKVKPKGYYNDPTANLVLSLIQDSDSSPGSKIDKSLSPERSTDADANKTSEYPQPIDDQLIQKLTVVRDLTPPAPENGYVAATVSESSLLNSGYEPANPYLVHESELSTPEGRTAAVSRVLIQALAANPFAIPGPGYEPSRLNELAQHPRAQQILPAARIVELEEDTLHKDVESVAEAVESAQQDTTTSKERKFDEIDVPTLSNSDAVQENIITGETNAEATTVEPAATEPTVTIAITNDNAAVEPTPELSAAQSIEQPNPITDFQRVELDQNGNFNINISAIDWGSLEVIDDNLFGEEQEDDDDAESVEAERDETVANFDFNRDMSTEEMLGCFD